MKWLAFYATAEQLNQQREAPLAGKNKLDYIFSVLNQCGVSVDVLAAGGTTTPKTLWSGEDFFGDGNHIWYPFSLGRKNFVCKKTGTLLLKLQVFVRILTAVQKDEVLACYHSLWYMDMVYWAKKIKGFRLLLELEEIYADVTGTEKNRKREYRLAACADGFIFPTELLNRAVNKNLKPYVVLPGSCRAEADRNCRFYDGKIHVVYAGTLDPRKGGSAAAVSAAKYLDSRYCLHILGTGSEKQRKDMQAAIARAAEETTCTVTYDGCLSGEAYTRFIQSCQIGLNTQTPDAAFNATSFPSKILSYMANGLRVVSVRIPAVETSAIGAYMYYYDRQAPAEIAKAIMAVDCSDDYDGRKIVAKLDRKFKTELAELVKEVTDGEHAGKNQKSS